MTRGKAWIVGAVIAVLPTFMSLMSPVAALARALVRFVHAVPGAGAAELQITANGTTIDLGRASFDQSTPYRSVPAGHFTWALIGSGGSKLASGSATAGNAGYTIIALAGPTTVTMGVYQDRSGVPGHGLLRVIHAAPELGSPTVELNGHVLASGVRFTQATPYLAFAPGAYELAAMKPGDAMALVAGRVTLKADQATSAIVVGSRGQRTRVVLLADRSAPLTRTTSSASTSGASRPPASVGGSVTVRRGDSLWAIARAALGGQPSNELVADEVRRLWSINADRIGTGDPNLIFPGTHLLLS